MFTFLFVPCSFPLHPPTPTYPVNGKLAISRTFGDRDFKAFGVTAEPDIVRRDLEEGDEYVILATDGVWDKLSNVQALGVCRDAIRQCRKNPFETYYPEMSIDDDIIMASLKSEAGDGKSLGNDGDDAESTALREILTTEAAHTVLSLSAQEVSLSALDLGRWVSFSLSLSLFLSLSLSLSFGSR
jgi:hypothetical protein